MLTINECRALLEADKDELSDEEIRRIRDWMYHMADIAIDAWNIENTKEEQNKKLNK